MSSIFKLLFCRWHPKIAEVKQYRIKKDITSGLVGNGVPMKSGLLYFDRYSVMLTP